MAINAEGNVTFCKNTKDNPKFYIGNLYKKTFCKLLIISGKKEDYQYNYCNKPVFSNDTDFCREHYLKQF